MHQQAIKNQFFNNSLLSSQEIKIDENNNLKVTSLSLSKKLSNTIPLALIDAQPKITQNPDRQLMMFALVNVLSSVIFYLSVTKIHQTLGIVISSLFMLFAILSFVTSYRRSSTTYTFYYKNTSTHLFSLRKSAFNKNKVQVFADQLKQRILEAKVTHSNLTDESSKYTKHLDFLYNHGLVNDVVYERTNDKINEKLYGIRAKNQLADIVILPVNTARNTRKINNS